MHGIRGFLATLCVTTAALLATLSGSACSTPPQQPPAPPPVSRNEVEAAPASRPAPATLPAPLPPGTVRVVTLDHGELEQFARRDSGGHPSELFYMGSDDGHDYYYLAHHTLAHFCRVERGPGDAGDDAARTPLTRRSARMAQGARAPAHCRARDTARRSRGSPATHQGTWPVAAVRRTVPAREVAAAPRRRGGTGRLHERR